MEPGHYTIVSGRRFNDKQIQLVRDTVETFKNLSRKELAFTLCENLNWVTAKGELKINSCLAALDKFEKMGIISLPAKKAFTRSAAHTQIPFTGNTCALEPIEEPLAKLGPIELLRVTTKADRTLWQEYVERYHYLGYKRPFGAHLRYFIIAKAKNDQVLGCMLFSAAAWSLGPRDLWIGWQRKDRARRLNLILNNSRFLILPWIKVEHLASHVLALSAKAVPIDWQEVYGYRPVMFETFVDTTKYEGTCYKAANWQLLGTTQGRGRMDRFSRRDATVKNIYAYPLSRSFRDTLRGKQKEKTTAKPTLLDVKAGTQPLWAKAVVVLSEICSTFDQKWQRRRRIIDTLMLVVIIFRLVLSKNSQSYATTIADMWKSRRDLQLILPQPRPIAASALTTARQKLDEGVFKIINKKLLDIFATEFQDFLWQGHRIFAVDGSKINLPRPLSNSGYTTPTQGNYPQGLVSTLYQLKSRLPYDFDLVRHANERKCATSHLNVLSQGDIVVYDRGYFSYSMLYQHLQRGVFVVFRLQKESFNEIKAFTQSNETDKLVSILPRGKAIRKSLREAFGIKEIEPLLLRLVKYRHGPTEFYLGTTLYDQSKYSIDELANVYHARWGIEELYKISKSVIEIEDFHSRSDRGVKQELYAHFVLITLSRIFANQAEGDLNEKLLMKSTDQTVVPFDIQIKVNFKNCIAVLSRHLDELVVGATSNLKKLLTTMTSAVKSCTQKFRPDRSFERKSMKPIGKWQPQSKNKQGTLVAASV